MNPLGAARETDRRSLDALRLLAMAGTVDDIVFQKRPGAKQYHRRFPDTCWLPRQRLMVDTSTPSS
jgi:hypothetical protein